MMKSKFSVIFIISIILLQCCKSTETVDDSIEPGIDEFIEVDSEPKVDLRKLKQCIEYPDIARRAGIEGRVIVRVLIKRNGEIKKSVIENTDNVILSDAAINAIECYGNMIPAIYKGKPIACWLSIPITFRLTNPVEKN